MKSKNILISGAGGYLALHIQKMLSINGYNVITSKRDIDGDFNMDFSNPYKISAMKVDNIDVMIHTVSLDERLYKTDPYRALSEHTSGIHSALDFCINNGISDFIYFSSFHVFGGSSGRLVETTAVAPCNDYGLSHCIAEQTVQMYNRMQKINTWIVRPSNVFGVPIDCERFRRWNLIPFAFCREAVEKNTITLLTSGSQLRNFVGISDLCSKVKWIIEKRPDERIIHAYGNDTMSVLDYALLVQRIALEKLQNRIKIIRPEEKNYVVEFEFSSTLNNLETKPKEKLETFVEEMLRVLLTH